ncbi:MAG: lasso peptide biosynthesis B2 protein [Acidobacteriota bacterium]|nr:lasso peptide biosynthesis B2 protein [Acidobacteriota bacterium]
MFLTALMLLPAVRVALKVFGLRRAQAVLGPRLRPAGPVDSGGALRHARRTSRLVAVAAQYAGGTCLARSVVLACLLERQGIPAQMRIGVRKGENRFEAHAWVEAAGVSLNEGQDIGDRYAAFDRDFAPARVSWR